MAKTMRHANGTGSITKLSGRRRCPYVARVTTGWNDDGTPIRSSLGTYSSRAKAQEALNAYFENPYSVDQKDITFAEVYDQVLREHIQKLSRSSQNGYIAAYKRCSAIQDKPFKSIKTKALQAIVDGSSVGYESRRKIVVLFKELYRYAMANDIVQKDYSEYVVNKRKEDEPKLKRRVFTDTETARLFELAPTNVTAELLLIMLYSGLRVGELFELKTEDIDLEAGTMRGGLKTAAGKNRLIPIHSKIRPFIEARYDPEQEYLIRNRLGKQMKYSNFREQYFFPLM